MACKDIECQRTKGNKTFFQGVFQGMGARRGGIPESFYRKEDIKTLLFSLP